MRIVCVSDLHVNSSAGLWPPDFVRCHDGMLAPQNRTQRWLWANWLNFCSLVHQGGDYIVIVNGDPLQGIHSHMDLQIVSPSRLDMLEAAKLVLRPLVQDAKLVFVVKGTMFHGGISGEDEEALARGLEATLDEETSEHSRWYLRLRHEDKLFTFAHHTPYTQVYHATPPARRWREAKEDYADFGTEIPDCIVRSHVHQVGIYPDRMGRLFITVPGWQLMYGFAYKNHPEITIRVGGLIMEVQGGMIQCQMPVYNVPLPRVVEVPSTLASRTCSPNCQLTESRDSPAASSPSILIAAGGGHVTSSASSSGVAE